jgi:hypothetical protein
MKRNILNHQTISTTCKQVALVLTEALFVKQVVIPFLIAVILFLAIPASPAQACSCLMPGPPQEEMEQAAAVFAGSVVNLQEPSSWTVSSADPVYVTFQVTRIWKGPLENSLVVETARDSASCGYEFEPARDYLVYAYAGENGLQVSLCSRTIPLDAAGEDLAALGEGVTPPPGSSSPAFNPVIWALIALIVLGGSLVLAYLLILRRINP